MQCIKLFGGELITPNQADTQTDVVMAIDMRADPAIRTTVFNRAVSADHTMIADAMPPEPQVHLVNIA